MTARSRVIVGISASVVLVIALGWFWSLGAISSDGMDLIQDAPAAVPRVGIVQGTVEAKAKDDQTWKLLASGVVVHVGDEVRTGANSKVEIVWGDRGVTRLDEGTDLVIQQFTLDANQPTLLIDLRLATGRVWSRMLKLLDVQSSVDVKTENIVATVRGTAFGVESHATTTNVVVTESVVAVTSNQTSGTVALLRDGRWGSFSATGTPIVVRDVIESDAWSQTQKTLDAQFDETMRRGAETRLRKHIPFAPLWLVKLSESVHLTFVSASARPTLYAAYLDRRIAQSVVDSNYGTQKFAGDVQNIKQGLIAPIRNSVLKQIQDALLVVRTSKFSDQTAPAQKTLVALRTAILDTSVANRYYAEAVSIDDAIDDALGLHVAELASRSSDLVNSIAAWKTRVDEDGSLSANEKNTLDGKADALLARLMDLGSLTVPSPVGSPESAASTSTTQWPSPTPSSTSVSLPIVPTSTQPATQITGCVYRSVAMFANPDSQVSIGQSVTLALYAVCPDGKTDDVTQRGSFRVMSTSDGRVTGNIFVPAKSGTITLQGSFAQNGITKTANATITAVVPNASRVLRSVSVSTLGSTTLELGQSVPLVAQATYSDGSTADVSYASVWLTSDQSVGIVSSQRFYATTQPGTALVTCAVTENKVTQKGNLTFTVQLGSGQHPTGAGSQPATNTNTFNTLP